MAGVDGEAVDMTEELSYQQDLKKESQKLNKGCTFREGYIYQRLFSCLTCSKEGHVGVCTACAVDCHEGHELVDLWEKRSFRCDCGTLDNESGKLKCICKIDGSMEGDATGSHKMEICNEKNTYGRNFLSKFCICGAPYFADDTDQGDMVQCSICQDWFHLKCLQKKYLEPESKELEDIHGFVCGNCMESHDFLRYYGKSGGEKDSAVVDADGCKLSALKRSREGDNQRDDVAVTKYQIFNGDWRRGLCKCGGCLKMYKEQDIEFVCDEEDIKHEKESADGEDEAGEDLVDAQDINILKDLPLPMQGEVAVAYKDLEDNFMRYLRELHETTSVVTKRHVEDFFQDMSNKRRRLG